MNNNYTTQPSPAPISPDQLRGMYPEIYQIIYPIVVQAVDEMIRRGSRPTQESISAMVDNIIKNSGMWDEDEDMMEMEAIPVQMGFGRRRGRRGRRGHHNRNTLRDITGILLLSELGGRWGWGWGW